MDAPETGEARLVINGTTFTLVYDWRAFSMLGKAGFSGMDSLSPYQPERLAEILAIGLARHHPDMTPDRIMAMSPPFLPAIDAVARAISYALTGGRKPEEEPSPDPPQPVSSALAGS